MNIINANRQQKVIRDICAVFLTTKEVGTVRKRASDIKSTERDFLTSDMMKSMYLRWGYRANEGKHDLFEEKTHTGLQLLQSYTDVVFRNIQQFAENDKKTSFYQEDTIYKLYYATPFDEQPVSLQKEVQCLLKEFFRYRPNLHAMLLLASVKATKTRSDCFLMMIIAARAILCLYQGNFIGASNQAFTCRFICPWYNSETLHSK
jgi:hypothetical protein